MQRIGMKTAALGVCAAALSVGACGAQETPAAQTVAAAETAAANACDRACLGDFERRYLQSVVQNDPSIVPLAADVRFTEDAWDRQPGEGLWGTATALRQHRLSVLDEEWQSVAGFAIVDEGDETVLLSYRLKVDGDAVSEVETLVSRYAPGGPAASAGNFAERETLINLHDAFHYEIPEHLRESREELIRIADFYPAGLKAGSFVEVDAPMAPGARRLENGTLLAGPDCTINENCRDMKTQPSPVRPTLRFRRLAVDEERGIAYYWLDWVQISTGNNLVAFEAFKVYDGNIQAVEAFLKYDDRERYPGWE